MGILTIIKFIGTVAAAIARACKAILRKPDPPAAQNRKVGK